MNIAFDARQLLGFSGINVYTRNLVQQLVQTYSNDTFTLLTTYRKIPAVSGSFERRIRENIRWDNPFPNRLALGNMGTPIVEYWSQRMFPRIARHYDLLHCTDQGYFATHVRHAVATVHDMIQLDPNYGVPFETRFRVKRKLQTIAKQKHFVFVPSLFVRNELLEHFAIDPDRIAVTHEAAGPEFQLCNVPDNALAPFGIEDETPFFLYIGRIDPRKNIKRVVQAYLSLDRDIPQSVKLVLIANGTKEEQAQFRSEHLLHPNIIHLTRVENQDLVHLLNRALALAFVSLSEGFGIPILEAMQCGCPVLTSKTSSMPEIGGSAAMYVDPFDVSAIRDSLETLANDRTLRENLRVAGLERASNFSWNKCAMQTYAGYEKALTLL